MENKQIGKINSCTESKFLCFLLSVVITILSIVLFYKIHPFNFITAFDISTFEKIMLMLIIILTLIIHEIIHILTFKYYGNGEAKVKIKIDKKSRAIVMQQINHNVSYSKQETMLVLLLPFLIITIISIILIIYMENPIIPYFNCILNAVGSSIDIFIALKLFFKFPKDISVKYGNENEVGMEIYKQ